MPATPEPSDPPASAPLPEAGGPRPGGRGPEVSGPRRPWRIAFFTDSYAPTHDGVARVTEELAAALVRQGHEVTVFTTATGRLPAPEVRDDGVAVTRHRAVAAPGYPEYRVALFPYGPTVDPRFRRAFDVVHVHTPGFVGLAGWLAARGHDLPMVSTYHTHLEGMLSTTGRSRARRRFYRAWSRFAVDLCRAGDVPTAPSAAALGHVTASGPVPAARVVPNGVDPAVFRPGVARPDWADRLGAGTAPLVTFLGRLTRDKGVGVFLDALLGPEPLVGGLGVVGGVGPLAAEVARRIDAARAAGAPVRFVGAVEESEKPALLAQSRIFVLPSLSDTSSVAVLEAMAAGAACVVTRTGGPAEIAEASGACLRVDPRDPAGLRAAVERLLREPGLVEELAGRARAWVVAHASIDRVAERFVECYDLAARRHAGRRASRSGPGSDGAPRRTAS